MNEKFNKNAKVDKFTSMLGMAVRLIVIDPWHRLWTTNQNRAYTIVKAHFTSQIVNLVARVEGLMSFHEDCTVVNNILHSRSIIHAEGRHRECFYDLPDIFVLL